MLTLAPEKEQEEIEKLETYISSLQSEVEKLELEKFPRAKGLPPSESEVAKNTNGLDPRILLKSPKLRGTGGFGSSGN